MYKNITVDITYGIYWKLTQRYNKKESRDV